VEECRHKCRHGRLERLLHGDGSWEIHGKLIGFLQQIFFDMRLLWVFPYFGSILYGQRVLYNGDLDKRGQDAAAAAKLISSDSVTAREIANLAVMERQQLDTALDASLNTMRLQIQSFDTWLNVYDALGDVSTNIETLQAVTPLTAELTGRQNEINESAAELKIAVLARQKVEGKNGLALTTDFVDQVVAHIGDVNDLLGLAKGIPGLENVAGSSAVNEVEGGLKELDDLLKSATAAIQAAKAGILGFTRSAAKELIVQGIRVNAVAPGFVDTRRLKGALDEGRQVAAARAPAGRLGTPAEIAAAVAFLASDDAAYFVGATLSPNGGLVTAV